MSSSISSSEPERGGADWRSFAIAFVVGAAILLSACLAFAYAVDPYDSGRSGLFARPGVRPQGPRTAAASRGRDPAFEGAIFGNSHIQLLSPERLSAETGIAFAQLSIPGTGPKEQFVLIDWFLRHRPAPPRALVVAADLAWCTGDPAMPNAKPFPFWLYGANVAEYVGGLLRFPMLEEAARRIGYVLARHPKRARPDGYWDYEPGYLKLGYGADPRLRARLDERAPDDDVANRTGRFPVADRFEALLQRLPSETPIVLVFPPMHISYLPRVGTPRGEADAACKTAFTRAASIRPRTAVVDWRVDRAEARDPGLFFDHTHYRQSVAQLIEADVAEALRRSR